MPSNKSLLDQIQYKKSWIENKDLQSQSDDGQLKDYQDCQNPHGNYSYRYKVTRYSIYHFTIRGWMTVHGQCDTRQVITGKRDKKEVVFAIFVFVFEWKTHSNARCISTL